VGAFSFEPAVHQNKRLRRKTVRNGTLFSFNF
jgi:hypothetical protein